MLVGALFSSVLASVLASFIGASGEEGAGLAAALIGLGGVALMVTLVFFAVPSLICGWGLLKFRGWARVLAIILGAIALLKFPVGTLFGVYVLVVMFRKDGEALFVRVD
jgi:uncharacterized membrane protein (DUF2068 family)